MVRCMEQKGNPPVTPGPFKLMEPMVLKADFEKLVKLGEMEARPTVARMRTVVANILKERNWRWVLLLSKLKGNGIGPS